MTTPTHHHHHHHPPPPFVQANEHSGTASVSTIGSGVATNPTPSISNTFIYQKVIQEHIIKNDFATVDPNRMNIQLIDYVCGGDAKEVYEYGRDSAASDSIYKNLIKTGFERATADKLREKMVGAGEILNHFFQW